VLEPDPELAVAYGIFSVRQALEAGFRRADIKRQLRAGRWIRLARGLLSVGCRSALATDNIVIDRLLAGRGAVVSEESAAFVHGWDLPAQPRATRLIIPPERSSNSAYRTRLHAGDVMLCGIVPVTTPLRTALDIVCTSEFASAVIILDSALRSGQVTHGQLHAEFGSARRNGVRAARTALCASDPLSGSVLESEARLLFCRAGLPRPVSQFLLRSDGRAVARVDFAWEEARLAVEIDGFAYHSAGEDFQRDRRRQNAVQAEGWLVLRFTAKDLRENPGYVIALIRWALARRLP
jgi:hypothetical protein